MKRSLITSSLAALSVAFLLPMGAHAATTTTTNATAAKHTTAAKSATAAKTTTAAKSASTTPATNATASKPTRRHHTMAKNASATKAKATKIDINTATREELMTLPGIDGDEADKIIAGRPYKSMAQLKTKGGLTNAEYRKISRKVTAKQAAAMHSEAPANGTPSTDSGAQSSSGSSASGSSDQTTK
ncbi:MAG TPA: helix-hairpin-helix domain-containing protein [Candidatus Eisenbacteria bacterium]|nr:helix-hairpin-helix domain-containing protein [Candidatus Eisenbacteria bacterium]